MIMSEEFLKFVHVSCVTGEGLTSSTRMTALNETEIDLKYVWGQVL